MFQTAKVFHRQFLSNSVGKVDRIVSKAQRVAGKYVKCRVHIYNIGGTTPRVYWQLEGSHDGAVWKVALGPGDSDQVGVSGMWGPSVEYPMVRLVVYVTGTDAKAIIDGHIASADAEF